MCRMLLAARVRAAPRPSTLCQLIVMCWQCSLLCCPQASSYRYLEGMEDLLARLSKGGYEIHALSNYPMWWRIIEEQLKLSRYLSWTFISSTGPMEVSCHV